MKLLSALRATTRLFITCLLFASLIVGLMPAQQALAALAAPTTLRAVVFSPTQVNLTWVNNSTTQTSYTVQRATDTAFTLNVVAFTLAANAVSYSDVTVAPSVGAVAPAVPPPPNVYYYRVYATDAARVMSPMSNVVTVTMPVLNPPAAPTTLAATVVGPNQINLTWANPAGNNQTGFTLTRATDVGFTTGVLARLLAPTALAYVDIAVTPATTYYYQIVATNAAGSSAASNVVTATTPIFTIPAAPTALTATIQAGTTNVVLRWTDNSGSNELGFYILSDTANTFNTANLNQMAVGANVATYTDIAPGPGVRYYRVIAYNLLGQSAPSNTANITVPTGASVPSAPYGLAATVTSSTAITLTWTNTAVDATSYTIQRATNTGFTNGNTLITLGAFNNLPNQTITYANTNLNNNTTYYYRVYATNAAGNSGYTNVVNTRTAVPTAPTGVTATATAATVVNVAWVAPAIPNQSGFRVDRATNTGFTAGLASFTVAGNILTYADATATAATTYYYRVLAVNAIGNSTASTTATVTTPAAGAVPAAPTGLAATPANSSQVNLTWTDNAANDTGYRVERATNNSFTAGLIAFVLPANTISYGDTTGAPATAYYYRVFATNAVGDSIASNTANVTTLDTAPAAPTGLSALVVSPTSIYLSWTDNAANDTSYRVDRATNSAFSAGLTSFLLAANSTSTNDSSVAAASTYYYRVFAINGVGASLSSNVVSVTTIAVGVPNAPSALTATVTGPTGINVAWTNNATNQTGFTMHMATDSAFTVAVSTFTLGAAATTYSVVTVPNTTYYFRIFATNAAGNSLASNTATATTPNMLPPAPTALTATLVGIGQINLGWTDNSSNETGFNIYTATDAAFTLGLTQITLVPDTASYSDFTVYPGDTFYYKITAFNTVGESAASNVVSVAISMPTSAAPAAPTGLAAAIGAGNVVNLTWADNSGNESGFMIERALDNLITTGVATFIVASNSVAFTDETAAPSVTYYYRVTAFNSMGSSIQSNVATTTTGAITVAAPTSLTVMVAALTQVSLNWLDNATNETGYRVQRATNVGFTAGLTNFTLPANSSAYTDGTAVANTTYFYRVVATLPAGDSLPSNTATITAGPPAAVTGLSVVVTGPTTITASWIDNSNSEDRFQVQRADDAAFTIGLAPSIVPANSLNYTDSTVIPRSTYYYRVYAVNAAGISAASNVVTITSADVPPVQPTNLLATVASSTRVNLSWTDNALNETGYRVERATDPAFTIGLTPFILAANAVSYANTTAVANTTYYYRVFAFNPGGDSASSPVVIATTPATTAAGIPTSPNTLAATQINPYQINLTWADRSNNEDGFRLYTATNAGFTLGLITIDLPANTTTYSDTNVYPGDTFYYKVTAFNVRGESAASNTVNRVVGAPTSAVPAAPSALTASTAGPNQVNVSWTDNSSNESGFILDRAQDLLFAVNLNTFIIPANNAAYIDTSVTPGTAFYYRVMAYNAAGTSAWSSVIGATTSGIPLPNGPTGLATAVVSSTQINLTWADNATNETGYRVERSTDNAFVTGVTPFSLAANAVSYNDTTCAASTTYYYRVFAVNASGDSLPSNSFSGTTQAAAAPAAPTSLAANIVSLSRVNLVWTINATTETYYRVDRATNSAFTTGLVSTNLPPGTGFYADTTATQGTLYYYRVLAANTAGPSAPSNTVAVDMGTPAAPTALTAVTMSATRVDLAWTDNSDNEEGFQIDRAVNTTFNAGLTSFYAAAGATGYSDTAAAANLTYYYRVQAFHNVLGGSAFSTTATATTSAPAAPTGLTATAASATRVNLAWTNPAGNNQTGFTVQRATDAAFTAGLATFTAAAVAVSYSDTTAAPATIYFYRVMATNNAGNSTAATATATTPSIAPATPTGLTALAISTARVDVSWTNNADNQTGFQLQRATNAAFSAGLASFNLAASATGYGDTGVAAATTYYYRVYATNAVGNSAASNTATVTTPASTLVPLAPTSVTASPLSATQAGLSWIDNATNETGYRVERATDAAFTVAFIAFTMAANTTSYSNSSLAPGTTYYYRVFATNASGESPASNVVSVTTLTTSPASPTNLTANAASATQVDLAWTDNSSNETGFRIERATNSSFTTGLTSFTAAAAATSYSDATAAASTAYFYRVFATNSSGDSAASNTATATTPAVAAAAPTGLTATAVSGARIDLAWTNNANNQTGFLIQRATDSAFTVALTPFTVGPSTTAYNDTSVVPGTTYYYRVYATNGAGGSAASNTATIAAPQTTPAAPTALTAFAISATRIDLAWTDNSNNESGFRVERSTSNVFTAVTPFNLAAGAVSYSDTTAVGGATYYYRVLATNSAGSSAASNTASAVTPLSSLTPTAPTGLTATAAGATQVNLAWTDNSSNETTFRVERATNSTFTAGATAFAVMSNATTYTDTTATAATTYFYRVFAVNIAGDSPASASASATTDSLPGAAPTNLTAAVVNANQVNLTWTNNAVNQTSFRLERATDVAFNLNLATFNVAADLTSYSDTSAAKLTSYYYRIYAVNPAGSSPASNTAVATTPDAVPAAPTGVTGTVISGTQINIAWTNPAGNNQTGFLCERSTNSAFTANLVSWAVGAGVTTYNDVSASPLTTYYYRVFATNAVGNSPASNIVTATTPEVAPAAPSGLVAAAASATQINLNWTDNANNETGFRVERALDVAFGTGLTPFTAAANATAYTDTSVAPNTAYYYRVFAVNAIGDSPASASATDTTPNVAPAAPSGLTAQAISTTQVNLAWTDNSSNETGFRVERADDAAFTVNLTPFAVAANVTAYSDIAAVAATTYWYRVYANNGIGDSAASGSASVTTPPNPAAPSAPSVLAATVVSATRIDLAWTDNANNETSFRVERATDAAFTVALTPFVIAAPDTVAYSDTTAVAGTTYYYRVFAVNAIGDSPASNAATGTTPSAPAAPSALAATAVSATQVNLAWTDNANNETGFRVERATNVGFTANLTPFAIAAANTGAYSDTTAAANTTYWYRVFATNLAGDSVASGSATLTTPVAVPAAPTGLTAQAISATRVDLAWTNNATNQTGFSIDRATNSAFTAGLVSIAAGNVTSYSDTTVSRATAYFYRVKATNAGGSSAVSNTATATTPDVIPSAPSGLTAAAASATRINLTWNDNSANETGFSIERASNSAFTAGLAAFTAAANATTYGDTSVGPATTYYYRVFATNAVGSSPASASATATTPDVAPAAPSSLAAQAITATQVNLSWTDSAGNESGFRVERATDAAFTQGLTPFVIAVANTASYNDTTAVAATTYYYRVFATNAIGDSAASNTAAVTTPAALAAPAAPSGLMAQAISTTQVNLSWTDNANNETGFRVERATDAAFTQNLTPFAIAVADTAGYSDTTAVAATTYHYRVFATNAIGDSPASNTATVATPANPTAPSAPSGLAATVVSATRVDLAWTDNANNETGFRVERAANAGFTGALTTFNVAADIAAYSDVAASAATTYYYRVVAVNAVGSSPASNTATATTPGVAPAAPTALTALAISSTQINLAWTDNAGNETGFRVERATDAAFTVALTPFAIAVANTASYSDTTVVAGTTYYYRVFATNAIGDSPASNSATATAAAAANAPAAPTALVAQALGPTQLNLTWTDNAANETGFRVERATDAAFTVNLWGQVIAAANAVSFNDTSAVANATTYYYRVFATNAAGDSPASNTASATTPDVPPAAPSGLTAAAAGATQVDLAWTNNANNQTGFTIQRATNTGFTAGLTPFTVGAAVTSYNDTTAVAATTYYYRVFATNAIASSPSSNMATATTPAVPALAPSGLVAYAITATRADLSWTNNANNQTGFRIERATDAAFSVALTTVTLPSSITAYSDAGLAPATTYYYRVFATNAAGASAASNTASMTTPDVPPTAATAVTATAASATQVNLAWTDNAGNETGFRIERATTSNFAAPLATFTAAADATSYNDTTAAPRTTYYYRVFATNAIGSSPASLPATATTPDALPAAPTVLTAAVISPTQAILSWTNNADNQTGFRLERATDAAFTVALTPFVIAANTTMYTDAALTAGATYWYRVFATNAVGDSTASNTATFTTPVNAAVPAAPSLLTAQAVSTTRIDLTWTNNDAGQTGLRLERATDAAFTVALTPAPLGAAVAAYSDTTVAAGTTYYYRIIATNASGDSPASATAMVSTPALATAPSAPTTLTAASAGGTSIDLTWTNTAANQTGFRLERATNSTFTAGLTPTTLAANLTAYTDAVMPATTYYYRIFATNATGDSPASNTATATTPDVAPAPPVNLVALAISTTRVDVSWTDGSSNETGFSLDRAADAAFTVGLTSVPIPANTTGYSDLTVVANTTYYYRVSATNAVGSSAASATASVTTPSDPNAPSAPINLRATALSRTQILLTWTNTSVTQQSLLLQRANNAAFSVGLVIFTLPANATSYVDVTVQPGVAYYYRITASINPTSPDSNVVGVVVPDLPPAAPSGLSASAVTGTQINLSWTNNANNQTGFSIDRALDSNFTQGVTTFSAADTAVTYTDTTVSAGTTYYYRVFATNVTGSSPASNTASATTPALGPAAPTGLSATAISSSRIDLAWNDNSSNETGFRVERAANSTFTSGLTSFAAGANATSYSDTSAAAGTTYYYRVFATSAGGDSPVSNSASATTPSDPPAAPTGLSATAANSNQVNLVWTNNANNQTGFTVERATDSGFTAGQTSFTTGAGSTTYSDTTVVAGTTYYYRVLATNAAGSSAASNTANVTTPASLPAAPGSLSATAISTTRVDLTWIDNATNETGYRVERATNTGFTAGLTQVVLVAGSTFYSDNSAAAGSTYYYRVFATNSAGSSTASNTANVTTGANVALPSAPGNLAAMAVSVSRVDVTWTNNDPAQTGLRLERAANSAFTSGLTPVTLAATDTAYSDTSVAASSIYYYRIFATNAAGDSQASNTATVTTPGNVSVPAAPTGLVATAVSSSQIDLSWTNNATNQTGFRLERATNTGFTAGLTSVQLAANLSGYSATGLAAGSTFYFRIFATNAAGDSPASNTASAATAAVAPAAATNLAGVAVTTTRIDLTWTDNANNETAYRLERATDAAFTVALIPVTLAANAAAYSDITVVAATTYYYRVFAVNAAGDSPASNTATIATPANAAVPAAPTALTATPVTGTRIDLAWTDNAADETGFRVERATDAAFTLGLTPFTVGPNIVAYSDTTAVVATTYYYRVFAVNAAGDSPASNAVSAAGAVAPPAAPSGLTATPVGTTQVNLAWADNATTETGFLVQRATISTFAAGLTQFTVAAANALTYSDTTAVAATTYYYRVYATNAGGNSVASNTATAVTPAMVVPAAPSALTATVISPTRIDLSWTNNANNQSGFRVERAIDAIFNVGLTSFTVAAAAVTTYSDTSAAANLTYYYRVFAYNVAGDSPASATATATTTVALPQAVTSLTAAAVTTTQVDLAWVNPAGNSQTGFRLERATDANFTVALTPFTFPATATSFSDIAVAPAITYYYRIFATNSAGDSPAVTANVSTPAPASTAPSGLTALPVDSGRIDLSWTNNATTQTGFRLERATDAAFTANLTPFVIGASTFAYSDTGLTANTTYYYRVFATDPMGDSAPSNTATTTTPAAAQPASPTMVTATAISPTQVDIAWVNNAVGQAGFRVERATDAAFTLGLTTFAALATDVGYSDTTAARITTYYYRVFATTTVDSPASNTATVMTPDVLPLAPTALGAVLVGGTGVTLTWTNPAGNTQTGFTIDRATDAAFTVALTQFTVAGNVLTYADATNTFNTTFYYRVLATNTAGSSPASPSASVTTLMLPMAPTGLTAVAASDTVVNLSWTNPAGNNQTAFRVERASDANFTAALATLNVAGNLTYGVDMTVTASTTYFYRVFATNAAGDSTASNVVSVTTPAAFVPVQTGGGGGGGGGGGAPVVTTTPQPGTTSLATSVDAQGTFVQPATVSSQNGSLNLNIGTGTVARTKEGNPVTEISVQPMLAPPVPPPTGTNVVALTYELGPSGATFNPPIAISLSYSNLPTGVAASDLQIFYYDTVSGQWVGLETTLGPNNTVLAKVGHFTAFTVLSKPKPQPPTSVTATAVGAAQVDLKWNDTSTGETGYRVERSTDPNFATNVTKVDRPANSTSYSDTGLTAGTTYYYRVTAIGVTGAPVSVTVSAKTQVPPPSTVIMTVKDTLQPIADKLVVIWGYDAASQAWQVYDPKAPAMVNDLSELKRGQGYFIEVSAATTLVYNGNTYDLKPGFNLIGWQG